MRSSRLLNLLFTRRFAPLFITQALEAFNDNAIRSVLVVMATFQVTHSATSANTLANASAICYTLPFILFSYLAGQLSEKFNKPFLIRIVKVIEVVCMALAGYAIVTKNMTLLLICIMIMGIHSTLFGPIKYAIIPDLVSNEELAPANAWIEASTFIMILFGYTFGIFLIGLSQGHQIASASMFVLAIIGLLSSLFIPKTITAQQPELKIDYHFTRQIKHSYQHIKQDPKLLPAILIISWFWYFGITLQIQFSSYTRYVLQAHSNVVAILIATMALGISAGAFICSTINKKKNSICYVPHMIIGASVFTFLLVFLSPTTVSSTGTLLTALQFFVHLHHWTLLIALFLLSTCAGFYILPLYVLLQTSDPHHRSRTIAFNNFIGAIAMMAAGIVAIILSQIHFNDKQIFSFTALINIFVAFYAYKRLPKSNQIQ